DGFHKAKELGNAPHATVVDYGPPSGLSRLLRIFGESDAQIELQLLRQLLQQLESSRAYVLPSYHAHHRRRAIVIADVYDNFVVLFVVTFLHLRGFDVGALGGFFRVSFARTLSTGAILLFFAYPLILLSDAITQRLFGGGSSKQNIVEFFSGSRTIEQRMMIIVFAIAIAPVVEEFLFRFFIYGVLKRYFGRLLGVAF